MGFLETVSDEEGPIDDHYGIKINKKFAKLYEEKKRRQELAQARDILSNDDESESETEDEDAEALTPNLDAQIMKTINRIRTKDPAIYNHQVAFFEEDDGLDAGKKGTLKRKKDKKMTFKDVTREQILQAETAEDVVEQSDDDSEFTPGHKGLIYDKEQQLLRRQFLEDVNSEPHNTEGQVDGENDLLKIRRRVLEDENDAETQLKNELETFASLEGDPFLKDFIMNKRWKDPVYEDADSDSESSKTNVSGANTVPVGSKVLATMDDSEDEEELEKAERFESSYNFRFEEDGGAEIQTYSRRVKGTVRREDDSRKKQRESRKIRKQEERKRKEEELRRLKNLKRQEIEAKLKRIRDLGGGVTIDASALEEDFDPQKFDEQMAKAFDDDYYNAQEEHWKPSKDWVEEGEELWNDENQDEYYDEEYEGEEGEAQPWFIEGEEEAVDIEDSNISEQNKSAIKQQLLDELYKLDYEDIIEGIPCRFKYKQVEADNFGLETEEILMAEDRELNQIISLKKLAPFREKKYSVNARKRARFRKELRERLKAAENETDTVTKDQRGQSKDEQMNSICTAEGVKKKRKKKGKKLQKAKSENGTPFAQDLKTEKQGNPLQQTNASIKKKAKKKMKVENAPLLTKSRLSSYGL